MILDEIYKSADIHMADLDHLGKDEPLLMGRKRGECLIGGHKGARLSGQRLNTHLFCISEYRLHLGDCDALSRVRRRKTTDRTRSAPKRRLFMHLKCDYD